MTWCYNFSIPEQLRKEVSTIWERVHYIVDYKSEKQYNVIKGFFAAAKDIVLFLFNNHVTTIIGKEICKSQYSFVKKVSLIFVSFINKFIFNSI